jgi:hypothetical protein
MSPDYDLSNLTNFQADLWLYLQADAMRAGIFLDQAARQASGHSRPQAPSRGRRKQRHRDRLGLQSASLRSGSNLEALICEVLEPRSRSALSASRSSGVLPTSALSPWVH